MAARELGTVSLADALALTLLTAEVGDDLWPRAAGRWLGRFIVESPAITIGEAGLAAAAGRISTFRGERWAVVLPVGGRRFDDSRQGGSEREFGAGSKTAESLPEVRCAS